VYSIAVMAVETLTGAAPPRSGATREWMRQAMSAYPEPERRLVPVLEQALADNPAERLLTARELGAELVKGMPAAIGAITPSFGGLTAETVSFDAKSSQETA
jgi:hypothetical protein